MLLAMLLKKQVGLLMGIREIVTFAVIYALVTTSGLVNDIITTITLPSWANTNMLPSVITGLLFTLVLTGAFRSTSSQLIVK